MLNQTGITKTSGTTRKNILIAPELAFSLPCKVASTGVSAGTDGKKIVKAGTPLAGDITARDTAFTVAKDTEGSDGAPATSNATCMLLHDVDVTSGTANASALIFGFVDVSKLESSVVTLLTTAAKSNLAKITLVK